MIVCHSRLFHLALNLLKTCCNAGYGAGLYKSHYVHYRLTSNKLWSPSSLYLKAENNTGATLIFTWFSEVSVAGPCCWACHQLAWQYQRVATPVVSALRHTSPWLQKLLMLIWILAKRKKKSLKRSTEHVSQYAYKEETEQSECSIENWALIWTSKMNFPNSLLDTEMRKHAWQKRLTHLKTVNLVHCKADLYHRPHHLLQKNPCQLSVFMI